MMTKEEYLHENNMSFQMISKRFSEPKFECPKCGGGMCKDNMKVLTSLPPQYEYVCNKCGHVEYMPC